MGEATRAQPVNLVCPTLAAHDEWLDAARDALDAEFGPVDMESETWPWTFSRYYEDEMGGPLRRRIFGFRDLMPPESIVEVKLATNRLESELAERLGDAPGRPVNLDPGYVSASKMVLATTKDYSHRIYLRDGIYAESTLRWRSGAFEPWEWTYDDYRTDEYRAFFADVRERYRQKLAESGGNRAVWSGHWSF